MVFSEAWLVEYNKKMNGLRSKRTATVIGAEAAPEKGPVKVAARRDIGPIAFVLNRPTPLLNPSLRTHWAVRARRQKAMAAEIASLVPHALGHAPIERAIVTITRYSLGEPDYDGLVGGCKSLIDCLHRLGIIRGDDPDRLVSKITSVRCDKRALQRTEVVIEPDRTSPPASLPSHQDQ